MQDRALTLGVDKMAWPGLCPVCDGDGYVDAATNIWALSDRQALAVHDDLRDARTARCPMCRGSGGILAQREFDPRAGDLSFPFRLGIIILAALAGWVAMVALVWWVINLSWKALF